LSVKDSEIYSLRFKYRAGESFSLQLWDVDERLNELQNVALYNDRVPPSLVDWSEFRTDIFVPSLRGSGGALCIGMAESDQDVQEHHSGVALKIEIRGLQISPIRTRNQPYHRLEMDHSQQKTSFLFVDDEVPNTLRGSRGRVRFSRRRDRKSCLR
jgi:hypothetical protein